MARRRKSSNDPLAVLITAFLMIPFVVVGIFKLLFKGISCLASLVSSIGRYIEKRNDRQRSTYRSQNTHNSNSHSFSPSYSHHSSGSTYKPDDNSFAQTDPPYQPDGADQNTESCHFTSNGRSRASNASLYELLRIPGDPDPDLTISAAPDECFDDLDDDYEEHDDEEIDLDDVDEDELLDELDDIEVSDLDITIMGLALYDALMNDDD